MSKHNPYAEDLMEVIARLIEILDEMDAILGGVRDYSYYNNIEIKREAIRSAQAVLKLALRV